MNWVEIEPVPSLKIWLTHSQNKYRKALYRFNTSPEFTGTDAQTYYVEGKDGQHYALVWMEKNLDLSAEADAALLAHEAVHVADDYFRYRLNEAQPSPEFRAYVTQAVTHCLVSKHWEWKRRKLEKRS